MINASLLPSNTKIAEKCIVDAAAIPNALQQAVTLISAAKWQSPPPSFLPFLIYELGLGELTPYVPNLYNLIKDGVFWQRVRGTSDSIHIGLGWIGYSAAIEEAPSTRRWWNSFQLRFASLPIYDAPDLERIEGITTLSVPKRSQLRRGVHQYDVGPLTGDASCLDGSMLDRESGVSSTPKDTIWSFGRTHHIEHMLTRPEGEAIGNWLAPVEDVPLKWNDMHYPWVDATFLWASTPQSQRAALLAGWFRNRVLYLCLRDKDDVVIGYRRCRTVSTVSLQYGGAYKYETDGYEPSLSGQSLYIESLTQFNDAADVIAAHVSIIVHVELKSGVPIGRLWLQPHDVLSGVEIAITPVSVPLRATVREQFKILMRF